jgi:hypothetical protein
MERIEIKNNGRMPRVFPLPHSQVCIKAGRCMCDSETGASASLHVPVSGRAVDLDPAVLFADDVRDAVDNQEMTVFVSKRGDAPKEAPTETPEKLEQKPTAPTKTREGKQKGKASKKNTGRSRAAKNKKG